MNMITFTRAKIDLKFLYVVNSKYHGERIKRSNISASWVTLIGFYLLLGYKRKSFTGATAKLAQRMNAYSHSSGLHLLFDRSVKFLLL